MNKKILGIFLVLILSLIPQTVFADSLYFETRIEEHTLKLDIDNDGELNLESSDGVSDNSFNLDIGKNAVKPIFDFFAKNLKSEDEIEYIKSPILEKLTDSPESYVLNLCDNKDCKTYFSNERPLFTVEELENSEIFNILETEIESFLEKAILIIAAIVLFVMIAPIFIVIIIISKLSRSKKKNHTTKSETVISKDEYINRIREISKQNEVKSQNTSKRKRDPWTDNDKNDPFSL